MFTHGDIVLIFVIPVFNYSHSCYLKPSLIIKIDVVKTFNYCFQIIIFLSCCTPRFITTKCCIFSFHDLPKHIN